MPHLPIFSLRNPKDAPTNSQAAKLIIKKMENINVSSKEEEELSEWLIDPVDQEEEREVTFESE